LLTQLAPTAAESQTAEWFAGDGERKLRKAVREASARVAGWQAFGQNRPIARQAQRYFPRLAQKLTARHGASQQTCHDLV
jgi:hypothetical protein